MLRHLLSIYRKIVLPIYHFVVPPDRDIWPDVQCGKECSKHVKKAIKIRSKGKPVTPIEDYAFHSGFSTLTDGKVWVVRTDSSFVNYSVAAGLFGALALFILIVFLYHGADSFQYKFFFLPPFIGMTISSVLAHLEKGHNKWIVFDRSSGNVCFWYKNKRKSLTVPFDQVRCYWRRKAYRGGVSKNLMIMPDVRLPGEWNRWWNTYFGSTQIYSQAQYLWRVLSDFMDSSEPIPELPGLTHQIRSCQRLGYTIDDLTHGGKEIPVEVWMEIDKEIQEEIEAIADEASLLLEPEKFSADTVFEYFNTIPPLARQTFLIEIKMAVERWSRWTRDHGGLYPGMIERFSSKELSEEIDRLVGLVRGELITATEDWELEIRSRYTDGKTR